MTQRKSIGKRQPTRRTSRDEGVVRVYQIKLTLTRLRPPIWRRLRVRSDATLMDLHTIFQAAMGWQDSHLHSFEIGGERFSSPHPESGISLQEIDCSDGSAVRLSDVLPRAGGKFTYEYDFGDGWVHHCVVESVEPAPPHPTTTPLASCVAGKRACPPEDCGGPWGYAQLLELLADPKKADPGERREWLRTDFDPAKFDAAHVDDYLSRIAASS